MPRAAVASQGTYSMELKYSGTVCELLSHQRNKLHLHSECTRSQQGLMLTKVNKLTCMPRWHSELAKCFAVLVLRVIFLATWNGGVVSGFPSTVCFTLGYVWYCIRSIHVTSTHYCNLWTYVVISAFFLVSLGIMEQQGNSYAQKGVVIYIL